MGERSGSVSRVREGNKEAQNLNPKLGPGMEMQNGEHSQ